MFKEARIKLTSWYLAIIITISLSFSFLIYTNINRELVRIENFQRARIQRIVGGFDGIFAQISQPDLDAIADASKRIIFILALVNSSILLLAGAGGYFLAGRTLDPIRKVVIGQKDFVSNASHELRTPLTTLKTEIEVALRDKNLSLADAKSLIRSNLEEVEKIQRLANYLLKLNKYEASRKMEMTKVDLKEIAEVAIGKRKVKKDIKTSFVTGNKDALVELVSILLDNAFKYSGTKPNVSVKVARGVIEVSDKGVGIAEVDIPHIFERFYRAESSRSKKDVDGYGLGLPIAKEIADLHGATLEVDSEVGKGTTMRVKI